LGVDAKMERRPIKDGSTIDLHLSITLARPGFNIRARYRLNGGAWMPFEVLHHYARLYITQIIEAWCRNWQR
jgi:hypothetical protein